MGDDIIVANYVFVTDDIVDFYTKIAGTDEFKKHTGVVIKSFHGKISIKDDVSNKIYKFASNGRSYKTYGVQVYVYPKDVPFQKYVKPVVDSTKDQWNLTMSETYKKLMKEMIEKLNMGDFVINRDYNFNGLQRQLNRVNSQITVTADSGDSILSVDNGSGSLNVAQQMVVNSSYGLTSTGINTPDGRAEIITQNISLDYIDRVNNRNAGNFDTIYLSPRNFQVLVNNQTFYTVDNRVMNQMVLHTSYGSINIKTNNFIDDTLMYFCQEAL